MNLHLLSWYNWRFIPDFPLVGLIYIFFIAFLTWMLILSIDYVYRKIE